MPYAKLRTELLAARDRREQQRCEIEAAGQTLLQLGTNLPGPDKSPAGLSELFRWGLQMLQAQLPHPDLLAQGEDLLGPWALLTTPLSASATKERALGCESRPGGRLLDIDVFTPQGDAIGRKELGLPPRPCLLCAQPAVDCIRLQNHTLSTLKGRIDELLSPFRP